MQQCQGAIGQQAESIKKLHHTVTEARQSGWPPVFTVETGDGPGPHPGVDFSDNVDVSLCLDGQRVFPVADALCPSLSGIASVGRPFRTEMDPATRICGYSIVSSNGENDFWLVFPKDGTMRRYGFAGNSALRPNNGSGSALTAGYEVQALDRIADASSNTG